MNRAIEICVHPTHERHLNNRRVHLTGRVIERPACLKLLLDAGAQVKHIQMIGMMWPIRAEGESVLLLYAAGFKGFEDLELYQRHVEGQCVEVFELFEYLDKKYQTKHNPVGMIHKVPSLSDLCREVIRDQLIENNTRNLFKVVPTLPLPDQVKLDLLFGATLHIPENYQDEISAEFATISHTEYDSDSDLDFI